MILNRRKFFRWLGVGVAASTVAPSVVKAAEALCPAPLIVRNVVIGEYIDYCNFSNMAIANAIDEHVENAAKELAYRQGILAE